MLIQRTPDVYEKLSLLGSMAGDDVLAPAEQGRGSQTGRRPYSADKKHPIPGVYRAAMPNGKFINLMRVMFTDFCKMDCAYCPNSIYVPRKRHAFKVDELAKLFMELHQRHAVAGLFLSSGIAGDASKTTERLIHVVETLRHRYGFRGYVHMKVMPGAAHQYVEAAHRLGTRLSINVETPTPEMMRRIGPHKDLVNDILAPMGWIDQMTRAASAEGRAGAVGQVTQLVVGAADETDQDIFRRIDQLYTDWNLKRVYYSAFRPVRHIPLEEHPATPPMREHRLYQLDWLKRIYQFSNQELGLAFDQSGFLSLEQDPKTAIAIENLDAFPVDVNAASREQLLRVPGVGPTSAQRILDNRRQHKIDTWQDLQSMGVVRTRAWPFLVFPGQRPPSGKQLRMDLFGEEARLKHRQQVQQAAANVPYRPAGGPAPCGQAASCTGCSMYGMPGHPGSER